MLGNIEILNLLQQKEQETIWCHNQIIILQNFLQKVIEIKEILATEIKKNRDTYKQICPFKTSDDYVRPK